MRGKGMLTVKGTVGREVERDQMQRAEIIGK